MINNNDIDRLADIADDVFMHTWIEVNKANNSEITHIDYILRYSLKTIHRRWRSKLLSKGIDLQVTGVFTHQTPMAEFLGKKCELADILVVFEHTDTSRKNTTRYASLIQTKKLNSNNFKLSQIDRQFILYKFWPSFELHGYGAASNNRFKNGPRNFDKNNNHGVYGIIDTNTYSLFNIPRHRYNVLFPNANFPCQSLGTYLSKMLAGFFPYSCDINPPLYLGNQKDFDVTVCELLQITANKLRSRDKGTRGYHYPFLNLYNARPTLTGMMFTSAGGGTEPPYSIDADGEPEPGMSIILIETSGEGPISDLESPFLE